MDNTEESESTRHRHRRSGGRTLWGLLAMIAGIAAIVTELRKPKADRTGTGTVAGFIPYDFRVPTLERARLRWWNAADPRVIVPRVFGVGWTVNVRSALARCHLVPAHPHH